MCRTTHVIQEREALDGADVSGGRLVPHHTRVRALSYSCICRVVVCGCMHVWVCVLAGVCVCMYVNLCAWMTRGRYGLQV